MPTISRWRNKKTPLEKDHWLWNVPGAVSKNGRKIANNTVKLLSLDRPVESNADWDKSHYLKFGRLAPSQEVELKTWLTPYQLDVVEQLGNCEALYLKWAGGAGKTIGSTVWAASACSASKTPRILVVTTSGAKPQWEEVLKTFTTFTTEVAYGESFRVASDTSCCVCNWDILAPNLRVFEAWFQSGDERILILDEIHKGKNHKRVKRKVNEDTGELEFSTLRTTAASMAKLARLATRRLGLSATPFSIGIIDLWSQLDAIEPDCWGKSSEFAFRYCDAKPGEFGGLDTSGASNLDELKQRLFSVMHVVTREYVEACLPGKERQVIRLGPQHLESAFSGHKQFLKEQAAFGDEALWEAKIAVAASMKRPWVIETTLDCLERNERVVILTNRRAEVERIAEALLKKANKKHLDNILFSHGGTESYIREEQRQHWINNPNSAMVLIGTHDAWGVAIDGLQNTDVAIMVAIPSTPRILNQSETRFVRKNQKRRTRIIYPIAEGTIDDEVILTLFNRLDTLSETLEGEEESAQAANDLSGLADKERLLADLLTGL